MATPARRTRDAPCPHTRGAPAPHTETAPDGLSQQAHPLGETAVDEFQLRAPGTLSSAELTRA
ncbi:hypothetical protein, partial [Streptomyces sp. NPDC003487]